MVDGHKKEVFSWVLQSFEKYGVPQNILTVEEALELLKYQNVTELDNH